MVSLSVVIPTRNRKDSLFRALSSLEAQTLLPQEVVIVDSSDEILKINILKERFPRLTIKYFTSSPSVCLQRNIGIRNAKSEYISLCDDDLELDKNYLYEIANYIKENPTVGAITGSCLQKENGQWTAKYDINTIGALLRAFILQTSIWGEINIKSANPIAKVLIFGIKSFYKKRSNTHTLSGWPLITQFDEPVFRSEFYGIGGAVIRQSWLLASPFDVSLDAHGIGDNYGVALGFPGEQPIHVLTTTFFFHHRALENRLKLSQSYERRIRALYYFLSKSNKFSWSNKLWFIWTVAGSCFYQFVTREHEKRRASWRVLKTIFSGGQII